MRVQWAWPRSESGSLGNGCNGCIRRFAQVRSPVGSPAGNGVARRVEQYRGRTGANGRLNRQAGDRWFEPGTAETRIYDPVVAAAERDPAPALRSYVRRSY